MTDEHELEPTSFDKESVIECTKCGWTTTASWKVDFDEDKDFYKKLLKDHEFMCSSDFPDFEVKEYEKKWLFAAEDIIQLIEELEEKYRDRDHSGHMADASAVLYELKKQIKNQEVEAE